jgi:hypothetical protein
MRNWTRSPIACATAAICAAWLATACRPAAEVDKSSPDSPLTARGAKADQDFVDVSRRVHIRKKRDDVDTGRRDYGPLWTDLDGDGWLDVVYMNHGRKPSFQLNKEGKRFEDRFEDASVDFGRRGEEPEYPGRWDRHGGSCADFDNDGDVDLFFAHGGGKGETLGVKYDELVEQRDGFVFEDVTEASGTLNDGGRARLPTWVDVDRDGWLDLYVGNYYSPNVLYKNHGDGTFTDVAAELGLDLKTHTRHGWADVDGDGDADLVAVFPMRYFRNDGDKFHDLTRRSGLKDGLGGRSVAWGDFDDNGFPDLFVAGGLPQSSRLFSNRRGKFTAVPGNFGPEEGERGQGAVWGDVDNDGDLDLIVANTRVIRLYENGGESGFVERALQTDADLDPGKGVDVALADYDKDGYLDLALNVDNGSYLLRNPRRGKHWLGLVLRGTASNRMGFGARVEIAGVGGRKLRRQYFGDDGFFGSAGCGPLHVGLGDARRVDVTVRWPSGRAQTIRRVPRDRTLRVMEPASAPSQM